MKRFLTILTANLIAFSLHAQQHLSFMDVPVDGPIDSVVEQLSRKGLIYDDHISPDLARMHYFFNGQPIEVLVVANPETYMVYRITVLTQPKYKWKSLTKEYAMYKKQLAKQYGEPHSYEGFLPPYDTKKKIRRHQLEALIEQKAFWDSFFTEVDTNNTKVGDITLAVSPYAHLARVVIYYEDALNSPVDEQNEIDNL